MAKSSSQERKILRKQRRCEALLAKDFSDLEFILPPGEDLSQATPFLAILNAGLSTGLTEECVLKAIEPYGQIVELMMVPNKSYCFLKCASEQDAIKIYSNMHSISTIGQNNTVVYLSYLLKLPRLQYDNLWDQSWPKGLILLEDFITSEEEQQLIRILDLKESFMETIENGNILKHRQVKHFGYEFIYGLNNVDVQKPLAQRIPEECDFLWQRLSEQGKCSNRFRPDQLTVNVYEPGQGIPPHVDTHSAFDEPILSLSLEGEIVMDFRRLEKKVSVLLPRRSLLIMSGEARYDWTHGITPRSMDVVRTPHGSLTIQKRQKRISLTFRRLREGSCNCLFPRLCDSRQNQKQDDALQTETERVDEETASLLEEHNVHKVYDQIAGHFSETRHTPWPLVIEFLQGFPLGSVILDVGCGNGKYMMANPIPTLNIGCDRSLELLKICQNIRTNANTFRCDCLNIPIRSDSIDGCISIAVIHHLATEERRLQAIQEMTRILRTDGLGLIYVWAKNQCANNQKSSYLRQNKAVNKLKTTDEEQRLRQEVELKSCQKLKEQKTIALPIHTNRTDFQNQDIFVPWKTKEKPESTDPNSKDLTTYLRYYHVFEESELEKLLERVANTRIVKSYYDQGNYCAIFQKYKPERNS